MPTEDNAVLEKTKELCRTILEQPAVASIRARINAFMTDAQTQSQYNALLMKGEALQRQQKLAAPATGEEIADFERQREQFLRNPVTRGFLDAQEQLRDVQESVHRYVAKTLELGRVPAPVDFDAGSCGEGCGCRDH